MAQLRIMVPVGTANAHTAQERYEEVMNRLARDFPGTLLSPIGDHGETIQVREFTAEQIQWLRDRREGWSIRWYTYSEGE